MITHEHTIEIVCPYCGYEFGDSWELNEYLIDGDDVIDCGDCGKEFKCSIDTTVYYSTSKLKEATQ